jgi:uncharacterized Zn-finger protein
MGNKPYKCPYPDCEKIFNEKGNLKTHYRIHTGEKPYTCKFDGCTQSFKAHGHLKDHMKRHLNLKPYECNICKAKFARTSTLKLHFHIHKNEKETVKEEVCDEVTPSCNIFYSQYNRIVMMNYLNMLKESNYHMNNIIVNNFTLLQNILNQQQSFQYLLSNNQQI